LGGKDEIEAVNFLSIGRRFKGRWHNKTQDQLLSPWTAYYPLLEFVADLGSHLANEYIVLGTAGNVPEKEQGKGHADNFSHTKASRLGVTAS
jgi:hypothetical protein